MTPPIARLLDGIVGLSFGAGIQRAGIRTALDVSGDLDRPRDAGEIQDAAEARRGADGECNFLLDNVHLLFDLTERDRTGADADLRIPPTRQPMSTFR
jgi:hypothetical protein